MNEVVERPDDPAPPVTESQPAPPPSRARFAAFAILFGLATGLALFAVLAPDGGAPALLLYGSIGLSLSSIAAMLVFRRMQLPLEAAHSLHGEQALRLQAFEHAGQTVADASRDPPPATIAADDVSALRSALAEARNAADRQRQQLHLLIAASDDSLLLIGRDGRIEAASGAAAALIDRTPTELLDRPLASLLPLFDNTRPEPLQHPLKAALQRLFADTAPERQPFSVLLERRGRTSVPLRLDARPLRDAGQPVQSLLLRLVPLDADSAPVPASDGTRATRNEPPDPLTGAPGPQQLARRIDRLNVEAQLDGSRHGLLLIALDRFDTLHARFGIAGGEQRLWQLAQLLAGAAVSREDLHRVSARHFALLLPRQPLSACIERAVRLLAFVAGEVWPCADDTLAPSISIGLAVLDGSQGPDAVLAAAADALRLAQQAGGGCLRQVAGTAINADWLRRKLDSSALRLAAQPILPTQPQPGSVEAPWLDLLVRVEDDDGVWLPLEPLIEQLEQLGGCAQVDDWLLDQALRHDLGSTRVSIRLAGASLLRDEFLDRLRAHLLRSRLPPPQVCIAVDEAFILDHPQRAALLRDLLSPFGCLLAIDRHRGSMGLAALRHFPASYLRLHEALVTRVGTDLIDRAHLEWLVNAARMFGARTVACAVRDADSRERMRLAGVDYVQGAAIAPPTPFSA